MERPMHPLDSVPAVRRLDTDRSDVLAIEFAGPVTGADVENLYGLLEGAYTLHDQIDLLVRWADGDEVDWEKVKPATVAEARDHAARHIRRYAAVGERGDLSSLLKRLVGSVGEHRRFAADEEEKAWEWIGARPRG
jgi:hypothetical protein